ncbi:SMI1/KNR4 family protein [Streptomyces sp. NBC_00239]|uniref:SMI1/KNR4 family protein n=1 Tax=Streptomyces sp. NBC_00239 TaxID=2903640 RepID=UPI002E286055|nr:SMI1/KNR4 family protein [Streptomyces sp. NBC_00239]
MNASLVEESWTRIESWLAVHAPAARARLRPPALPQDIEAAERRLGVTFPPELRASLLRHDGVELEDGTPVLAYYGPLSGVDDIVRSTEFLRDVGADLEDDEEEYDEDARDEFAYWPQERLLITLGIGWQSSDGLFLVTRPGRHHGRIGRYFDEDSPSFTPWQGLGDLLADFASALEAGTRFDGRIPLAVDGVLIWDDEQAVIPDPVSVLALAAASEEPRPEPVVEEPAAAAPDGFHAVVTWSRTEEPQPVQPDVVFVAGVSPDALLERLGAVPESARPRTRAQARLSAAAPWAAYRPLVRVGTCGAWSYATQEAGEPQFDRPEVLRRLTRGTRGVLLAKRGPEVRVTVVEDGIPVPEAAHLVESPRVDYTTGPDGQIWQAIGVDPWPGSTAAYTRLLAGLAVDHGIAWHPDPEGEEPAASALLLPVLADLRPASGHEVSSVRDFDLAGLVARTPPERMRAATAAQLVRLAAETGLDAHPEVSEALDRIGRGEPVELAADGPLDLRMRSLAAETRATRELLSAARYEPRPQPVTDADLSAWAARERAAGALRAFVLLPAPQAAEAILHQRMSAHWRTDLAADLA